MGSIIRGWWRGLTCTSAAEEEVWPLTTQSTLQNEWGGGGKVEAHSNTYRYSQLPGSAAFPWSVLLCSHLFLLLQSQFIDTPHTCQLILQKVHTRSCARIAVTTVFFMLCLRMHTDCHTAPEGFMGSVCVGNNHVLPNNFLKLTILAFFRCRSLSYHLLDLAIFIIYHEVRHFFPTCCS